MSPLSYGNDKLISSPLHDQHDHMVQFYDDERYLCASASRFITSGLRNGEAAIVIATREHCHAMELGIWAKGVDVDSFRQQGQLVLLDAQETLNQFMVGKRPDKKRFEEGIGDMVGALKVSYPSIRAYGEMVNVLCAQGNYEGALELEILWNELIKRHGFSLLCGYSLSLFKSNHEEQAFQRVCQAHSHVFPAEKYSLLQNSDAQMRFIASLQQKARALENEVSRCQELEKILQKNRVSS